MTLAEMERKLASLERRVERLEAQPQTAIEPRHLDPPRLSSEVYDSAFWERMETVA